MKNEKNNIRDFLYDEPGPKANFRRTVSSPLSTGPSF